MVITTECVLKWPLNPMIIKHSLEDVMIKVVLSSFTPDVQLRATPSPHLPCEGTFRPG